MQPALVKLGVLEEDVEGCAQRRVEPASSLAEAAAQKIKVYEAPGRIGDHPDRSETSRLAFDRGLRAQAVDRRDMVSDVAVAEMENRRLQSGDVARVTVFEIDAGMRFPPSKARAIAAKQTQMPVRV